MEIGSNLKKMRSEKGLSQKELADALNVSPQAVSRWENDEVEPDISTLNKLSEIFNVSVDELINGVKEKKDLAEPTVVINIESKEKQVGKMPSSPVVGKCDTCGKDLHEGEYVHFDKTHLVRRGRTHHTVHEHVLLCKDCDQKRHERIAKQAEERKNTAKNKHIKKIVISGIFALIALFVSMIIFIKNFGAIGILEGLATGIVFYETLYCLICESYILDVFETMLTSSIKFPGIIFTWDLDGFVFLIVIKVLFAIIGFLVGIVLAVAAIAVAAVLSFVSFPFILTHNIKYGLDD